MYEFLKVGIIKEANQQNAAFLAEVFGNPKLFTEEYIKWQYADHPMGQVLGYNAILNNQIVSHFVLQPFPALFNGVFRKGLLAFNTATNELHRRKGFFTTLAKKTIDDAINEGYEFIVAVTNHNSKHGFIKHLGFQEVCQLKAKIGLGGIGVTESRDEVIFEKFWDKELLKWRLANPLRKYFVNDGKCFSKTHLSNVKAFLYNHSNQIQFPAKSNWRPFTLYIGMDNSVQFSKGLFFNIPEKLKPSPLFLIFRDLKNNSVKLDKEKIRFNLIDFDAY